MRRALSCSYLAACTFVVAFIVLCSPAWRLASSLLHHPVDPQRSTLWCVQLADPVGRSPKEEESSEGKKPPHPDDARMPACLRPANKRRQVGSEAQKRAAKLPKAGIRDR